MHLSIKRLLATPVVAGALATAMLAGNSVPAHAASAAAAVVTGSGTVSPPLAATPSSTHYAFTSTIITTVGVVHGNASLAQGSHCTSAGGTLIPGGETLALGAGTGGWGCDSGPLAGSGGSLVYVREGGVVEVLLLGGLDGALLCAFAPTPLGSAPPYPSYTLACGGAGASTS